MYFRSKTTKTGKALQLVESCRDREGNPRQQLVVSLGDLDVPKQYWGELARRVEDALYGSAQQYLISPDVPSQMSTWVDHVVKRVEREGRWCPAKHVSAKSAPSPTGKRKQDAAGSEQKVVDGVNVDRVSHTRDTSLGPILAGLHIWQKLGMPELLDDLGFSERHKKAAAALTLNRLDEPVSEHGMPEWLCGSSLPDLLGEELHGEADDTFYRTGDKLLNNRERIEAHLRRRQTEMFSLERTILLYDLTNTHFEGLCTANEKARRGRNKQKRHDCPQVVIGMVFDEFGFEVAHRTFNGNMNDSESLLGMLEQLQRCSTDQELAGGVTPLVVMDAGLASAANRRLLRRNGFSYLVNDTRGNRKQWREEFAAGDFTEIRGTGGESPVQVRSRDVITKERTADGEEEHVSERLVFCRSARRKEKELAIRSRAEQSLLDQLKRLRTRVETGRLKDPAKIQRHIGRILQKNPRVARYYEVSFTGTDNDRTVQWTRRSDAWEENSQMLGCYVLRTDQQDISAERLWELYVTLTRAEESFRMLKSELGLRPNHHQLEERVDAHIFITVLAHQLLNAILHTMRNAGDTRSWPTLRRVLQPHSYSTVILPTVNGETHKIRRAGTPEARQQYIYETLGVNWRNLPRSEVTLPTQN